MRHRIAATAAFVMLAMSTTRAAELPPGNDSPSEAPAVSDFQVSPEQQAFIEDLSRRTFNYFWETTDAESCLAPDRWPSSNVSSIAAIGFAMTAYGIGAERGYVSRVQAADRTLNCLKFFYSAPQGPEPGGVTGYKGFFYHFLTMDNGVRYDTTELSTVDTSLMLSGVLFAQSYFDGVGETETAIRELADKIYWRVDWTFFLRRLTDSDALNLPGSRGIAMGWKPGFGFLSHDWVGYNEGMLVYILALGSPTHPVSRDAWVHGWASKLEQYWGDYYGEEHLTFEPMFGHQYSHIWIDYRGIQDTFMRRKGIDYFENSRRATLSQYAYAEDNPNHWVGYGGDIWGLTASDGPGFLEGRSVNGEPRQFWGYTARGVSPFFVHDDGTIAPTAAGGSIPFAPEITIPALLAMKEKYGPLLYTEYGFRDSFNPAFTFTDYESARGEVIPGVGWFAHDHLGIDQGPILTMIENYRSGLIWRTMRKNPYVRSGLREIGFDGGWLRDGGLPIPDTGKQTAESNVDRP